MGEKRILVGKPEGTRPLGRPRRMGGGGVDSIKMNLRETGRVGTNWTGLALDMEHWRALVYTVMNLVKFLSICTTYGFIKKGSAP
jgi:hypothetical protein